MEKTAAYTVYLGDGHDADVLTISGCWNGSAQTGQGGGDTVGDQGTMESGILQQVSAYDLGGHDLMSDVLGDDYQRRRNDDQDGIQTELREEEVRQSEDGCAGHGSEVYDAHDQGYYISYDDRDQDRNGCCETSQKHLAKYSAQQCDDEYDGQLRVDLGVGVGEDDPAVGSGTSGKLQSDEGNYRAHGGRWKDDIDPVDAYELDDDGNDDEDQSCDDETAQGVFITQLWVVDDQQGR